MTLLPNRCRLLLVARASDRATLRALISGRVPAWDVVDAAGVEQARLVPCDVVLLDAELARNGGGLDWVGQIQPLPVAVLADDDTDFLCAVMERGASHWLPRGLALRHPAVLAAVLRRAATKGEVGRQLRAADVALADCRRQVERLVNRLWETVPSETGPSWFTQRHMLERLDEEVQRVKRHGGPLSVVLGEVLPPGDDDPADLAALAAEQVGRGKRRSDVAGQYGPHGFMMLLPRTGETGALGCCERLRALLEQPPSLRGPLRAYFGVAALDGAEETITTLLSRAEERLEEARSAN